MSSIAIYIEGGGNTADGKSRLRQGFGEFLSPLRDRAHSKGFKWRIILCGGRDQAFEAFDDACARNRDDIVFLLVDSEDPVHTSAVEHLSRRDGWSFPANSDGRAHLMVQVMEAWFIADPETLSAYYGQGFHVSSLPRTTNLEMVSKHDIERALNNATRQTKKERYHKIRDGASLLSLINRATVRHRLPSCEAFLVAIEDTLA